MAGRPRKKSTEETSLKETTKKVDKVENKKVTNKVEKKEEVKPVAKSSSEMDIMKQQIELQHKQIEELKKMLLTKNEKKEEPIHSQPVGMSYNEFGIRPDKRIRVISEENNKLILATKERGQGKTFTFEKFGSVRNITYQDLTDIILVNQTFAEAGKFYIDSKEVVNREGLTDVYEKILTPKQMKDILTYNKKEIEDLFKRTTESQRKAIVSLIITKINTNEEVDLNKVSFIGKLYGQDIEQLASQISF